MLSFKVDAKELNSLQYLSEKYGFDFQEVITVYMFHNDYFKEKTETIAEEIIEREFIYNYEKIKAKYKENVIEEYAKVYESILGEIKLFPIPINDDKVYPYIYGDTFGELRTYGGNRGHYGTDIFDRDNVNGRIPVISVTNGVVEQKGWNEKGGNRVGIRTDAGNYYYYAHLSSYADNIKEGMRIEAGHILGYMGDTGYSIIPGTRGNFPVHLHFGIELSKTYFGEPLWINPYAFLRLLEDT